MDLKRYEIFTAVSFSEIDLLCYRCLNSETTMNPTPSYTPPPDPLESPSLRRSSSASDESTSSVGDDYTAMTTPDTAHHKLSPLFASEHDCPVIVADFA